MRRSTRVYPFLNSQGTRLEFIENLFVVSFAARPRFPIRSNVMPGWFRAVEEDVLAISLSVSLFRESAHSPSEYERASKYVRVSDLTGDRIETRVRTCYRRVNAIWDLAQFVAECLARIVDGYTRGIRGRAI